MKEDKAPKTLRKSATERRRYPVGMDPRKDRRRQRAAEREAARTKVGIRTPADEEAAVAAAEALYRDGYGTGP